MMMSELPLGLSMILGQADVCPNNWIEEPNLVETHVARATRFRSLSQQFNDHVTPGLQLDDDGYLYDAETGK